MNNFHLQLRELVEFLRWGDHEILVAARSVSDQAYFKPNNISVGSIHKLLVHCMAVEWLWVQRFRGESPKRLECDAEYPSRMDLEQRWPLVHSALVDFVGRQSPQGLMHPVTYQNTKGETITLPLRDMVLHLVDHGSYHRGQLNTMIKQGGGEPAQISYRQFALHRERIRR